MNPPEVKERKRLAPGTVLDERFEIAEFLGAGSFGEVYRAKQLIFGQPFRSVALKLFSEGAVTTENAREVLNDAIVVMNLLEEKHTPEIEARLVQVLDMGILRTPAPRAFMSMKLIPGGKTIRSEVNRYRHHGGMPVTLSLRYLRELLLPLAWMHSLETPVVHGDLKPENIMMTEESRLVLVDFGLAAHMPLGALGGDIAYLAPEKLLGLSGEEESDVYSVGVIWYELLTGVHPFAKVGLEELARGDSHAYLQAHLRARRRPIAPLDWNLPLDRQAERTVPASDLNQDLAEQHPQVEFLLNKCLADDISERHANARILLDQIEAYLTSGTLSKSDLEVVGIAAAQSETAVAASGEGERTVKSDETRLMDARVLRKQGKLEQALHIAREVLLASPRNIPAWLLQIELLLALPGRLGEAATACDAALGIAPKNPDVYEALAVLRTAQGKPAQAESYRKRAADLRRAAPNLNSRSY